MNKQPSASPPAILIGEGATVLSVARSLWRREIQVYALSELDYYVRRTRSCQWIPLEINGNAKEAWTRFLLGPESEHLRGAVLLSVCDAGIEILAEHREALSQKFLLDDSNPQAQLWMLNKLDTYRLAAAAGVPVPRFWAIGTRSEVLALQSELIFPLIVKPIYSHLFQSRFPEKYLLAQNFDQLLAAYDKVSEAGLDVMLVEKIPGPDHLLCSYYTYLNEAGEPLFDFTKRVIRRHPVNMGLGCYHITDWNPAVRTEALKLFQFVGLRGLANAEFKLDERDGQLKLIECNARFTAANHLVAWSGYDLAILVYNRLTGQPLPRFGEYKTGMRLWSPFSDLLAFRELNRRGELSFREWARSIKYPLTLPYFCWKDPGPSLSLCLREIKQFAMRQITWINHWLAGTIPSRQPSTAKPGLDTETRSRSHRTGS